MIAAQEVRIAESLMLTVFGAHSLDLETNPIVLEP